MEKSVDKAGCWHWQGSLGIKVEQLQGRWAHMPIKTPPAPGWQFPCRLGLREAKERSWQIHPCLWGTRIFRSKKFPENLFSVSWLKKKYKLHLAIISFQLPSLIICPIPLSYMTLGQPVNHPGNDDTDGKN